MPRRETPVCRAVRTRTRRPAPRRGLLAEHSGVFKSMLHVAQAAPDAAEQAYGCDVVQLDDLAEDLRGLFKIIFPLSKNLK